MPAKAGLYMNRRAQRAGLSLSESLHSLDQIPDSIFELKAEGS